MSKLQSRGGDRATAEPTEDATELSMKTDEPAVPEVAPEAEPTDEASSNQSRKNQSITILEEDAEMGSERYCRCNVEPADPAAVDKGTVVNYLDTIQRH